MTAIAEALMPLTIPRAKAAATEGGAPMAAATAGAKLSGSEVGGAVGGGPGIGRLFTSM